MLTIKELSKIINKFKTSEEVYNFLLELLTESEVETLSKRWRILKGLASDQTQREISKNLQVSLCKVTRGSKILKNKNSVISKYFSKENK